MIRPVRLIALCALVAMTAGCAAPYYWQAIGGQLELLRKREPIEQVVADPAVDPTLKSTLTRIAAMRRFAVEELGLPSNKSYTSYAALDRPYVVWNVVATEEFSVDPRRWCFPFAGCVAYRGYFDKAAADRFAVELAADGLDTHSGGSTAYSTLGYFDDPVLSTMVNGGEQYVASLLFHELAHQKLYVKDDSEFSEAFAMVIEELGYRALAGAARCGRPISSAIVFGENGAREFGELIAAQQARLRAIYASGAAPAQLREEKERAFDDAARRVRRVEGRLARQHGLRRVVRATAEQRHARIGRDLHELVAGAARAPAGSRARGVLRGHRGRREARRRAVARNSYAALGRAGARRFGRRAPCASASRSS